MFDGYKKYLVRTKKQLKDLENLFLDSRVIGFDFETVSLEDLNITGVCLADKDKKIASYIGCEDDCELSFDDLRPLINKLISQDVIFVGHNYKFDFKVFKYNGFSVLPKRYFDTMIASWALNTEEKRHPLDLVSERFLNYKPKKGIEEIRALKESSASKYWEDMFVYGIEDAVIPLELRELMLPELEKKGLRIPTLELEMGIIKVTCDLELSGMLLDRDHMFILRDEIEKQINTIEKEVKALIGIDDLLLSSPQQLSLALFDRDEGLKLNPKPGMERLKPRKEGDIGVYSTKDEVLKLYEDNPAVEKLLEFRWLYKLLTSYVRPLIEISDNNLSRVHSTFNQIGTATGRYSSSKPFNAQTMPRRTGTIRKGIIAEKGFKLLAVDYSQIELRIMAHQSQDPLMIELYSKGADIHKKTACEVLGIKESQVTKEIRNKAKAINFGLIYGMSPESLMASAKRDYGANMTLAEAKKASKGYFELYKNVAQYHDYMREYIRKNGYTENVIGQRRYLQGYNSKDNFKRWRAWSSGVNFTIQGSAAALIKIAGLNIYNGLTRPFGEKVSDRYNRVLTLWNSDSNLAHEVRYILQVHDEMVYEVREEILPEFTKWVIHKMENALSNFSVPIIAEANSGYNLEECK